MGEDDATLLDPRCARDPTEGGASAPAVVAGRYEVLGLLGVGAMGLVYRVRDRELDELVALKMLKRDLLDASGVLERFRLEVKLARKVTSPNVARTFDIGEHAGERFLTMELVEGTSLAAEIEASNAGLAAERVVGIAIDVCKGLAAAHDVGVVHRDLKPDNVLLGLAGSVKITDFGIAKLAAEVGVTHSAGTPVYMAPEQVTGASDVDARADLYALGVMLYEMLTRESPWTGDTSLAVATARLFAEPPDVRRARPDVPPALADLVSACMARDRSGRPSDARAIGAALASMGLAITPDALTASAIRAVRGPAQPRETSLKHVAVVPFRSRGAPEDAYLAEGMTDDIIDALAMAHGLRVWSRRAVMRAATAPRDAREIGRDLGAHVVVDGMLERVGDSLRVSARLLSVADGFQLWAKRVERPLGDLLAVADELARAISAVLAVETGPKPTMPRDPLTVDLYVRARREWHAGGAGAIALFQQALDRAPDDPMILAACAMARLASTTSPLELEEAVRVAERAVLRAPQLAEGHLALGHLRLHKGQAVGAARSIRSASELAPSSADAHLMLGRLFGECGSLSRALQHLETSQKIDPTVVTAAVECARLHALLGEWACVDEILATVEREKRAPFLYWQSVIRFAVWRRDAERIRTAMDGMPAAERDHPFTRQIAMLLGGPADDPVAASLTPRRAVFVAQLEAETGAFRDRPDDALLGVERAVATGLSDVAWMDACPVLDGLRADPRFAAARATVAARAESILEALGT